jgi:hypothetical protein
MNSRIFDIGQAATNKWKRWTWRRCDRNFERACSKGDMQAMEQCLNNGARKYAHGCMAAMENGHWNCANYLLQNYDMKGHWNRLLTQAWKNDQQEMVEFIMQIVFINDGDCYSLWHNAVYGGMTSILKHCLQDNPDINDILWAMNESAKHNHWINVQLLEEHLVTFGVYINADEAQHVLINTTLETGQNLKSACLLAGINNKPDIVRRWYFRRWVSTLIFTEAITTCLSYAEFVNEFSYVIKYGTVRYLLLKGAISQGLIDTVDFLLETTRMNPDDMFSCAVQMPSHSPNQLELCQKFWDMTLSEKNPRKVRVQMLSCAMGAAARTGNTDLFVWCTKQTEFNLRAPSPYWWQYAYKHGRWNLLRALCDFYRQCPRIPISRTIEVYSFMPDDVLLLMELGVRADWLGHRHQLFLTASKIIEGRQRERHHVTLVLQCTASQTALSNHLVRGLIWPYMNFV